jgi:VWFA-related protein
VKTPPLFAASLSVALAVCAAFPFSAAGQQAPPPAAGAPEAVAQPPSFPSQVEQVIVDVVVADKKGNAVAGLGRGDMTILEDGVPQPITSFEAVTLPSEPAPEPAERPSVSVNTDPVEQRGRTFVIVFDDTHMTPGRANQAKAAVAAFLEQATREGDRVSVVSTAGGTWWTARMPHGRAGLVDMVKRLDGRYIPDTGSDRLSEYEALRVHVYRDAQVAARVLRRWENFGVPGLMGRRDDMESSMTAGTVDDPLLTGKASEVYFKATTRTRLTLETLERAINGLAGARGRKSVILVSEGFVYDNNLDEFRRVNNASRRANAAIYFVNSRGLEGMPSFMTAEFGQAMPDQDVGFAFTETLDAVSGSDSLADDSGGFTVRNTNDLTRGIQKIANETQAYYLLGYIPSNAARDGRFRKIQVKLADAKGLQVRARKGYFAPSDTPRPVEGCKGIDPVLQSALDSPWAIDDIPLRMTHFVADEKGLGKAGVLIAADIDVRALEFEEKDGRHYADLQFLLVVAHRETGEFFRYDQTVNMKLLPATRERLGRQWYPLVREFELKPGDYQAKIVTRETRSGRVGTVMHEFTVPPLDQFRVATPVLGDARIKLPNGELGTPVVTARREFVTGSDVYCALEVYGAKADKDGMPRVVHGYEVRKAGGGVLTGLAPSPIRPTSLGHLSRMFGFRLTDATPGDYEIVMTVRDELAGKTLDLHERFKVLPEPGKPPSAAAAGSGAGVPANPPRR